MAADFNRRWRRIRRRANQPPVRAERFKALGAICHNGGLALVIGAGVAPFLNPSLQPDLWVRIVFFALGGALVVAGQVLLCYMYPEADDE